MKAGFLYKRYIYLLTFLLENKFSHASLVKKWVKDWGIEVCLEQITVLGNSIILLTLFFAFSVLHVFLIKSFPFIFVPWIFDRSCWDL